MTQHQTLTRTFEEKNLPHNLYGIGIIVFSGQGGSQQNLLQGIALQGQQSEPVALVSSKGKSPRGDASDKTIRQIAKIKASARTFLKVAIDKYLYKAFVSCVVYVV